MLISELEEKLGKMKRLVGDIPVKIEINDDISCCYWGNIGSVYVQSYNGSDEIHLSE